MFYAQDDLKLSSGFGNSIAVRGGPAVRKELAELGPVKVTDAVATSGGNMKAKYIIHADGPKFQEEDTEKKTVATLGRECNPSLAIFHPLRRPIPPFPGWY